MKLYAISMVAQRGDIVHHVSTAGRAANDDEMTGIAFRWIQKGCRAKDGWGNHSVTISEIPKSYALGAFERVEL